MGKNGIIWVGLFLLGCNPGNQTTSHSSAQYAAGPSSTHNPLKENFEECRRKFRVYWDRCIQYINVPNAQRRNSGESCVKLPDSLQNDLSQRFTQFKSEAMVGNNTVSAQNLGAFAKKQQPLVIQVFGHWTTNHKNEAQVIINQELVPCNEMGNETAGYVWDPGTVAGQGSNRGNPTNKNRAPNPAPGQN
jgi:hypothetical protein